MADECIVCLGSLTENQPDHSPSIRPSSPHPNGDGGSSEDATTVDQDRNANDKLIASLPSCGHYLHNECLKSWIERANSCPICRKTFNSVDLWTQVGGPPISSYTVDDKIQEAVIDPDLIADVDEDEEDEETQVCQVCQEGDNEEILMYCDSCEKLYHTYCVSLQEVPVGHWFCDHCRIPQDESFGIVAARSRSTRSFNRRGRGRTRGQRRRYRQQDRAHEQNYIRVWQSVWDQINLDLDNPFDDEEATAVHMRRQRQRTDQDRMQYQAWQRRAQIAEIQGGANRFRDTAQSVLDEPLDSMTTNARRARPATPPQESLDELRAWQAFERARELEADPVSTRTRKRKSATTSPVDPEHAQHERRIKRPRARRQLDMAENSDSAESSSRPQRRSPATRQAEPNMPGPSFLQSLLKEVEGSSTTPNERERPYLASGAPASPTSDSPAPSSPILSPAPSNHPSPRAGSATPPPHFARPGSPTGLSSSILPIFPHLENGHTRHLPTDPAPLSPTTAFPEPWEHTNHESSGHNSDSEPTLALRRVPRHANQTSPPSSRPRSLETSPVRHQLSLNAKQNVQKMVSAALKPFYSDGKINKENYTNINRDVSRLMYGRIGAGGVDTLAAADKQKLEQDVEHEVRRAVEMSTASATTNGASDQHD